MNCLRRSILPEASLILAAMAACDGSSSPSGPELVEIPEVPLAFPSSIGEGHQLPLGPVILSELKIEELGPTLSQNGAEVKASGTFWRVTYKATNVLDRPVYAVPMLALRDDRSREHHCVLMSCDRTGVEAIPPQGHRDEVAIFDIPKKRRPFTLVAHGARPEGELNAAEWRADGTGDAVLKVGVEPFSAVGLDKSLIDPVIERKTAQILDCYQRELISNPTLGGKITVRFEVAKDGSVNDARIRQSFPDSYSVEGCIIKIFRKLQFPAPPLDGSSEAGKLTACGGEDMAACSADEHGENAIVSYSMIFQPGSSH